ncbi:MAG: hypothetical protein CYPHOPRED_001367 [Cyphobasidiales sp. Tagirdzhanova-0007]|nr:MAG: hypothetical protein CYPHOPRED_001367 [Cyphobasidiales sp. Tagirdzhanova-0007]
MVSFTAALSVLAVAAGIVGAAPVVERGSYTGKATYFYQGGQAGACEHYNSDSSKVVALDSRLYNYSYCGKKVVITNTANGKTVVATVADECPGCSSTYSLDLSVGAFTAIGNENTGVLPITWYFE